MIAGERQKVHCGLRVAAGGGGAGRLAHHEPAGQPDDTAARVAVDGGEEVLDRGRAELFEVEVDRGQGRPAVGRVDVPVVVADDGDVVGDGPAEVVEGVAGAGGDLVVAAEDGVEVGVRGEQGPRRVPAPAA